MGRRRCGKEHSVLLSKQEKQWPGTLGSRLGVEGGVGGCWMDGSGGDLREKTWDTQA